MNTLIYYATSLGVAVTVQEVLVNRHYLINY